MVTAKMESLMERIKLNRHAWSLTWRFMICFVVLSYPVFTTLTATMQEMTRDPENVQMSSEFILLLNLLIPLVIPYFSMYGALAWYYSGREDVA